MTRKALVISIDCLRADAAPIESSLLQRSRGTRADVVAPNLHGLVETGHRFGRAVTTSPYTTAAHASAFTGCHPIRHGVRDYFRTPMRVPTIFERAQDQGIHTSFVTDYPLILGHHLGFTRGVDDYRVEDQNETLEAFLRADRDSLLFVHFADLHFPYGCHRIRDHREYLEAMLGTEMPRVGLMPQADASQPSLEARRSVEERIVEHNYRRLLGRLHDLGEYDRLLELYWRGVERFDAGRFAPFAQRLRDSGHLHSEDGLTILFGDHGEDWSPTSWAHFNSCDLSVLNVPVVLWGSQAETSRASDALVGLVDVAPSVVEFFRLPDSSPTEGNSLLGHGANQARSLHSECWLSDTRELVATIDSVHKGSSIESAASLTSHLAKDAVFSEAGWLQRHLDAEGGVVNSEFEAWSPDMGSDTVGATLQEALELYYASAPAPPDVPLDLWTALARQRYFWRGE